ncbi:hypothetical protein J9303_00470 [Bacillaceae bacterium Marseille-Q3522]|nr:hypothetical protein [Bacillaceae bacterium Marseille-Q3522]
MDQLKQRLLEKLKKIKKLADDTFDTVLDFALQQAIDDVLIYCHIEEIPAVFESTLLSMSLDILNEGGFLLSDEQAADGRVKAIKEGDTQVTMMTEAEIYQAIASMPSFAKRYKSKLNVYRKLVF